MRMSSGTAFSVSLSLSFFLQCSNMWQQHNVMHVPICLFVTRPSYPSMQSFTFPPMIFVCYACPIFPRQTASSGHKQYSVHIASYQFLNYHPVFFFFQSWIPDTCSHFTHTLHRDNFAKISFRWTTHLRLIAQRVLLLKFDSSPGKIKTKGMKKMDWKISNKKPEGLAHNLHGECPFFPVSKSTHFLQLFSFTTKAKQKKMSSQPSVSSRAWCFATRPNTPSPVLAKKPTRGRKAALGSHQFGSADLSRRTFTYLPSIVDPTAWPLYHSD